MAAFTPGDLVVYRVGTGGTSLSSAATAVFLDEYTPTGTLVQSIALPTTDSGLNQMLTASGTATSEGLLTLSADGHYLELTGYDASVGTSGIASTSSATVHRVIGRVDGAGNIDTSTTTTAFSANNIRGVVSSDGNNFWLTGANGGVQFETLGSGSSTQISSTNTNLRAVEIFNGQLYVSSGSGSVVHLGTVGAGEPTTSGQTTTTLPGFPTTGSQYEFFFADLTPAVAGVDTLYVANDSSGIFKYSLDSGVWTLHGQVGTGADAYRGLTGTVSGTTVTLYATGNGGSGATGGGKLASLTDPTGYDGTLSGTPTTLVTAPTNEAFRGVAFAPQAAAIATPWINEFHYDNLGTDASEFIEIAGAAGTDLSSYSLVLYNGTGGASYDTKTLSGVIANQQNGFGTISFAYPVNGIQNGSPDGFALVGPGNNVIQFLSYEGTFAATNGPASGMTSTDVGVSEPGDVNGQSLQLVGTGTQYSDFTWHTEQAQTSGAVNTGQSFGAPGQTVAIADASITEGDSGTKVLTFTVTRTDTTTAFTVDYATAEGSATAGSDYVAKSGTLSFTAGGPATQQVTVTVNGDTSVEPDETFTVNLGNIQSTIGTTTISDNSATGTILNDDVVLTPIYTIQGSGHSSPLAGQVVTTQGIVTAVDTTSGGEGSRGFYLQDTTGDGNAATSDAIFVFRPSGALPTVGHLVQVIGTVQEFTPSGAAAGSFSSTELSSVTNVTDLGVGLAITPVQIGGTGGLLPPSADLAPAACSTRASRTCWSR